MSTTFDNVSYTVSPQTDKQAYMHMVGQFGGKIFRTMKEYTKVFMGKQRSFSQISYSTKNKDGEDKICAISIFEKVDPLKDEEPHNYYHWAYLFTTNDPLNCDNFNKYSKSGKCVEQSAFCEGKAKVALSILKEMGDEEAAREIWRVMIDKNERVDLSLMVYCLSETMDDNDKEFAGMKKEELTRLLTERYAHQRKALMERYVGFLESCLCKPVNLPPLKNYKFAGRKMLNIGGFLDEWSALAVPCVTTERSLLQDSDQMETEFLVGMRARCVIECSTNDKIWAYEYQGGDLKMAYFDTIRGHEEMFDMIDTVVHEQDGFITALGSVRDDANAIKDLLLEPMLPHKLGLSIRMLQALYTKELVFTPDVHGSLACLMASYGLTWNTSTHSKFQVMPSVERSIWDLACSIGVPED